MTGNIIANRYAKALFSLGCQTGDKALNAYAGSLGKLRKAVQVNPSLAQVFRSPIFTLSEKRNVLTKLAKSLSLDKTVHNFCLLLAEKNRMDSIEGIASAFDTLLDARNGIIRGEILTAVELEGQKQEAVLSDLEKKAGRKLALQFGVAPEILGGVVLKVGDKVMDASLRAQLSILKDSIKRGE